MLMVLFIVDKIQLNPKNAFNNADVVRKFIFRYLSVPLTYGLRNILVSITNKDTPNKLSI
jgi:hypothetical protein